ncbi:hypothetical protein [Lysinibacillus sp. LZ02]|uniref:hypothetical protein n=1 Tax=Lysinibacillus sp. LZ02 TaxID=3420668 RepID=UPI003D36A2A5
MRSLFYISVIIAGLITAFAFFFTNLLTVSFDPANDMLGGGNGNPGLFFVVAPFLIILYFYFSMLFVFEQFHQRFTFKQQKWLKYSYLFVFLILTLYTFYRATMHRNYINANHPYMEVGLLSQFSNHLFFNVWTFIALLCLIAFLSFFVQKKAT